MSRKREPKVREQPSRRRGCLRFGCFSLLALLGVGLFGSLLNPQNRPATQTAQAVRVAAQAGASCPGWQLTCAQLDNNGDGIPCSAKCR